jgi:integrase
MGSVRKKTSGSRPWEARWYGLDGRQHSKNFTTKTEALRYIKLREGDRERGDDHDPKRGRTTLGVVADEWLRTNPGQKERTRIGYEQLLRTHVLPYFGDTPLNQISKTSVQQFLASMEDEGKGAGTIRNTYRNVLKPVLNTAVDAGYLRSNPAAGIKPPRAQVHEEMLFLTAAEIAQLAEEVEEPHGLRIEIAAWTGLRANELVALRMKNLDLRLKDPSIHVEQAASEVTGKGLVFGPTKSYEKRSVSLPANHRQALALYTSARADDPEAFVFVGAQGGALRHSDFYARIFRPAVERLVKRGDWPKRLRRLRFHDLRHTAVAQAIATGANPKMIQARMGHSSIAVTLDRYGHLFPGVDKDLALKLDERRTEELQGAGMSIVVATGG